MSHTQPTRRVRAVTAAFLLAGAFLAAVLAPPASAAPPPGLYGATGVLGNDTAPPSNLYRIDPSTGAATTVGPIGYAVGGLALDPTAGVLYGVTTARELTSAERYPDQARRRDGRRHRRRLAGGQPDRGHRVRQPGPALRLARVARHRAWTRASTTS